MYETTLVIDSLVKNEDTQTTINKVESFINNNGGVIVKNEDWGKKRLAYEINRKQYGNYYHIQFKGPGTLPGLLEREFRLEETVLRYLIVKTAPHILRAQAKAETKAKAKAETEVKAETEIEIEVETETETETETAVDTTDTTTETIDETSSSIEIADTEQDETTDPVEETVTGENEPEDSGQSESGTTSQLTE